MKKFFYLIFIVKFLECLHPFSHGDSLAYHLVGGRYWLESGFMQMTRDFYLFFIAGIYDYLYVIPNFIFGVSIKAQILGQMMHFLFGIGGSSLLLVYFFEKRQEALNGYICGLSLLLISQFSDFFLYAKNDAVVATFSLLIMMLIINKFNKPAILGLLIGLMCSIKMNGLVMAISLVPLMFYRYGISGAWPLMSFLGFLPILARNTYYLHSPFFPGLLGIFPGLVQPEMIKLYEQAGQGSFQVKYLLENIRLFILPKLILLFNIKSKNNSEILFVSFLYFIIMIKINGAQAQGRFYFPTMFLMIFYLGFNKFIQKIPLVLLLILIFSDSKLDKSFIRIINVIKNTYSMDTLEYRLHYIPLTKLWEYVKPNSIIISDVWSQAYYAPKGVYLEQLGAHPNAEFLGTCNKIELNNWKKYRYAILTDINKNECTKRINLEAKKLFSIDQYTLFDISEMKGNRKK